MAHTRTLRFPSRRTALKFLHWGIVPLFVWFLIVQPKDIRPFGPAAFQFHSILGLIFVSFTLVWFAMYLRKGLASRPGPKLQSWARRIHRPLHLVLIWGLFFIAVTGFLLGLTSSVLLMAGGVLPTAPPLGLPAWNDFVGYVHYLEFYSLALIVLFHAGFHVWRHIKLRDNALRIMAPRMFHRYL